LTGIIGNRYAIAGDAIYGRGSVGNADGIVKRDLDGQNPRMVARGALNLIGISDNHVYYHGRLDYQDAFFRTPLSGGEREFLSYEIRHGYIEHDGWLYFIGGCSQEETPGIYRMRYDGSEYALYRAGQMGSLRIKDGFFYYVDVLDDILYKEPIQGGAREAVLQVEEGVMSFSIAGDWIFFSKVAAGLQPVARAHGRHRAGGSVRRGRAWLWAKPKS